MNEIELEQLVADRVAARRDAVQVRPDFSIRIMRALEAASPAQAPASAATHKTPGAAGTDTRVLPRRRLFVRELLLASAVFVFVALLAGGAAWLRSQSQPTRHPVPPPKVSAASLVGVNDVHMMTAQVGWAFTVRDCSACYPTSILRTTDGGLHWTDTTGPLPEPVAEVVGYSGFPPAEFFLDSTHAWYADHVSQSDYRIVIHSTADGGMTWHKWKILSLVQGDIASLQFVDPQHGWITIGSGGVQPSWEGAALYQTVDGGKSWTEVEVTPWGTIGGQATVGSLPVTCLKTTVFIDRTRGWASGNCPAVANVIPPTGPGPLFFYRTTDGGRTWSRQALPVPAGYPSNWFDNCFCSVMPVQFSDPQDGTILVLHESGSFYSGSPSLSLVMFITHDGGSTWEARALPKLPPSGSNLSYGSDLVDFINGSVGWLREGALTYRTDDGGQTWTQVYQAPQRTDQAVLDFVDQSHGWAISSDARGQQLVRTTDGGRTWLP